MKWKTSLHYYTLTALLSLSVLPNCRASQQPDGGKSATGALIWQKIKNQLDDLPADSSLQRITAEVDLYCAQNEVCRLETYRQLVRKLEQKFKLPVAIYVLEEIVRLAETRQDSVRIAQAYHDLFRFHDALGNQRLAIVNINRSQQLYEAIGNKGAAIYTQMIRVVSSYDSTNGREVLDKLEQLLRRSESIDANRTLSLHISMMKIALDEGRLDQALEHIQALEAMPVSEPIEDHQYGILIEARLGRAELSGKQGEREKAIRYYQEALQLSREEPARWVEILVLRSLAELAMEQSDLIAADRYLDTASSKAAALQLHDHLAAIYFLKSDLAELQQAYADALNYTRQGHFHQAEFERRGAGFDIENYYLKLEKEQLASETENQELELRLKESKLRNSSIRVVLAILLIGILAAAYFYQRKRKLELSRQNRIIQRQAERLAALDSAKSRFFANVSHELRTPLTLIRGPIQSLLKSGRLESKERRLLEMVASSSKQLDILVRDILDLSKLEAQKLELQLTVTPLRSFFSTQVGQFESMALRKGLDFKMDVDIPSDLTAEIDQPKCRQIVNNLLSNAIKFTEAGGQVMVRVNLRGKELHIQVSDTGRGISEEDLPHIFDRYFQTHHHEGPAEGGTGIGLALCQEYVHLFVGRIQVESTLGLGTSFYLSFPLHGLQNHRAVSTAHLVESKQTVERVEDAATSTNGQLPTILVVEDQAELREFLRLILADHYQVLTAENGSAALALLGEHPECRLVLSDLMMPVMDGFQLLESLKAQNSTRHLPVIMLTARAEGRDRLKALRIGVDDYLVKPFDEEELLARIHNLLKHQSDRRASRSDKAHPAEKNEHLSAEDRYWLESFENHVRSCFTEDTLTVAGLAQYFHMSESTLLRQLKRLTGLTPVKYLQEMRLDAARRLLEERTFNSVARVAREVGYSNPQSFSRSFKRRFGKSPSAYFE